jgi:hypothetical protein
MICQQCGAANAEDASRCANCLAALVKSASPSAPAPAPQPRTPAEYTAAPVPNANIRNYLAESILVTLFCCLPFGIVALAYSSSVNGKSQSGDLAGAREASAMARAWCFVSMATLLLFIGRIAVQVMFSMLMAAATGGFR